MGRRERTRSPADRLSNGEPHQSYDAPKCVSCCKQLVDDSFAGFKQIVMDGRPKFKADPAALDAVATGQIFTAKQAVDKGLVDSWASSKTRSPATPSLRALLPIR